MCVKLITNNHEAQYNSSIPLESQIGNYTKIVVNYEPSDENIKTLISELKRISKNGINAKLEIEVNHNNHIFGVKAKKELQKASNDITLNEFIRLAVTGHIIIDQKLQELSNNIESLINVKAHAGR